MTRPDRALVWRLGLQALAFAAVAGLLWRGRLVVQLFTVAAVLAAAAWTPVAALVRRGWRRGLAVALVLGGALVLLLAGLASIVPMVLDQAAAFAEALPALLERARDSAPVAWLDENFELERRGASALGDGASTLAGAAVAAASGLAGAAAGLVAVVAFTAFLLTSGPELWRGALRWVHPERRPRADRLGTGVREAVAGYVLGALLMAAIGGAIAGITTLLLGVPYWLPLAVTTAVLGLVPYVGALASGAIVVATTFLAAGRTEGLVALGVFLAYQQLEGAVLQPLVQRRTIEVNPLVVAFAVLVGTAAAGVYGGVMALPFVASAKVVAEDVLERRHARWRRRALREAAGAPPRADAAAPARQEGPPH